MYKLYTMRQFSQSITISNESTNDSTVWFPNITTIFPAIRKALSSAFFAADWFTNSPAQW